MRFAAMVIALAGCSRVFGITTQTDPDGRCDPSTSHDEDHDGIPDDCDLCPVDRDTTAGDLDGDGIGAACDPDDQVAQEHELFGFDDPTHLALIGVGLANDDATITAIGTELSSAVVTPGPATIAGHFETAFTYDVDLSSAAYSDAGLLFGQPNTDAFLFPGYFALLEHDSGKPQLALIVGYRSTMVQGDVITTYATTLVTKAANNHYVLRVTLGDPGGTPHLHAVAETDDGTIYPIDADLPTPFVTAATWGVGVHAHTATFEYLWRIGPP